MSSARGVAAVLACAGLCALAEPVRVRASNATAPGQAKASAREILIEHDRRNRPQSEAYLGEVVVIAGNGKERRKTWRSYRAGPAGASDRLIRFVGPPDVRGVGYLAHFRRGKPPDEWLYLPSMKRERRIGARDRDAAFVGTAFSYEDLDLMEFDETRYDARLLGQPPADARHDVIELTPRVSSAYSKKVLTLDADTLGLESVEFFAPGTAGPVKRLVLDQYERVGPYLLPTRLEMTDLRKGVRTIVMLHDIEVDRPQPADRYTIQNLLREDDLGGSPAPSRGGVRKESALVGGATRTEASLGLPPGFSGSIEARGFLSFGDARARSSTAWQWTTAAFRQTVRLGSARLTGGLRLENSSSAVVGPFAFDPADRRPRRSAVSLPTLSLTVPLHAGLDVEVGRFTRVWGETDGYSPADAFLPRDLSDPLTDERLPVWGASVRAERRGVRAELLFVPVTTPWRLPPLSGASAFASIHVDVVEHPWTVPRSGFGAVRVSGQAGAWDMSAWARSGIRPAPVLVLDINPAATPGDVPSIVPVDRHFANEHAGGVSLSHPAGGWIARAEVGGFRSSDPGLGNAAIWAIGASRVVGNGTFTGTIAGNAIRPPSDPLLMFDRALLPCAIVAVREVEGWGSWGAVWIATFQTVGGVISAEVSRDLSDELTLTVGADLPHGAALSPATAFSGGQRVRAAVRLSW